MVAKLHALGLLQASFRPDAKIAALRTLVRYRAELIQHRAPHILHMQRALQQMNIQLERVLSDILSTRYPVRSGSLFSLVVQEVPMSVEDNKAVVRRLYEAINAQDGDTLDEVLSPELAQEFKHNLLPWLYSTFAGHRATITDLIAEGDKVVARLATRGMHSGEWHGVAPTQKEWSSTGIYVLRLEQNKVVEFEGLIDDLEVASQIGASLALPSSSDA